MLLAIGELAKMYGRLPHEILAVDADDGNYWEGWNADLPLRDHEGVKRGR